MVIRTIFWTGHKPTSNWGGPCATTRECRQNVVNNRATNYERSKIHKIHRLEPQISHSLLSCHCFKRWWTWKNLRENLNPTEMNMFYPLKSHIPVFFLDQQPPLGASMLWKLSWNLGHCGIWSARVYPCSSISKKNHEHLDLGMSQNLKIVDPPPLGWCWTQLPWGPMMAMGDLSWYNSWMVERM